jgi:pantoate--beta-alanine ligase
MLEIIETVKEMQEKADALRAEGKTIGFVPTMGALHEGHQSLIRAARRECQSVVVSIFVNPTQFAPGEDYRRYPRDFEGDCKKAEATGADIVFRPSVEELYPPNACTIVRAETLSDVMCGRSRAGHFQGVATVVCKLFNITKPHRAYFGEKDYQQLVIVKRMVRDLDFDIVVVGMPTVREADGLAMSSRNVYLNPEERKSATVLYCSLREAEKQVSEGEKDAEVIIRKAWKLIESTPHTKIDYIVIVDPETLQEVKETIRPARMALAVKVGKARLIDNIKLCPPG